MDFLAVILVVAALVWLRRLKVESRALLERLKATEMAQGEIRIELAAIRHQLGIEPQAPRPASAPPAPEQAPTASTGAPTLVPEPQPPPAPASVPAVSRASPAAVTPDPARTSLEERLGTRWSVWVGGLALALGGLLLVRYSIEQGLIGPGARIALGALLALVLAGAGEWMRRRDLAGGLPVAAGFNAAHIPAILTGAGTIVALGTTYAAHALYGFIGPAPAFVLLAVIGIAALLAAAVHGPAQAGVGLAGSLLAPALVSSPDPSPWPVVTYLAVVAAAGLGLARLRQWLWLGAAVVAGAAVWAFLLIMPGGRGPEWTIAAMVHTLVQLALAGFFIGVEPHAGTDDDKAQNDPIAAGLLAALTATAAAVVAAAVRDGLGFTPFAAIAAAILAAVGTLSAAAAAAAALAGALIIVALIVWPGLPVGPPAPPGFDINFMEALPLPADVGAFLAFAGLASVALGAACLWRLWRGPRLLLAAAGLLAGATVVTPLAALVVAYLRVTQFDRSIPFALAGGALALALALAAEAFARAEAGRPGVATRLATGACAAGAIAALSFALTASLERGYLTVAFALAALGAAWVATRRDIPVLRHAVSVLGAIVLARVAIDPRIMGASVGATPILNWLLVGYGVPALAFALCAHLLRTRTDDSCVRIADGLAVLFAALLVFFEIRHILYDGDVLRAASGHVEQGLMATAALGFAYVLGRLDRARANPVYHAASLGFGMLAAFGVLIGLGLAHNPLFTGERIAGASPLSSLALAYLVPGVLAILVAHGAREARPAWYVTGAAILAALLMFGYVSLEVRHAFQGPRIGWLRATGAAEQWTYSAAWLALGLAFLAYGIVRGSREARLISAALVVVSVLKVFLLDLAGLTGLWRAISFISLGFVLIGIGLVYQRLIFHQPRAAPVPPGG